MRPVDGACGGCDSSGTTIEPRRGMRTMRSKVGALKRGFPNWPAPEPPEKIGHPLLGAPIPWLQLAPTEEWEGGHGGGGGGPLQNQAGGAGAVTAILSTVLHFSYLPIVPCPPPASTGEYDAKPPSSVVEVLQRLSEDQKDSQKIAKQGEV